MRDLFNDTKHYPLSLDTKNVIENLFPPEIAEEAIDHYQNKGRFPKHVRMAGGELHPVRDIYAAYMFRLAKAAVQDGAGQSRL